MKLDQGSQPSPHSHPPRWFLYRGAIAVSVLGMILNFALFVAGGNGVDARNGEPLCTGVGLLFIILLGFALLILSILSAILAYLQAEKTRTGATICLVISTACLFLFAPLWILLGAACAGG
jgi:hypothetical protein